ncbi:MAG: epimerase [Bacteroidetes bacterium]|nr:epimerase [Bacteroidota bacterium]
MKNIEAAYKKLLDPSEDLIADISKLDGDILILGAGGKMGPALAKLARQAIVKAGISKKIIAISRFSEPVLEEELNREGIETICVDLLGDRQLQALPDVKNVLYLAGTKFGTAGNESFTWAMNTYLPGRVAEKYKKSNIVVFSSGNTYHLTPVTLGGATEERMPQPVGEYAQSCLGRERIFQYFSLKYNTPILIYRLNYANDVSYGVLLEIARSVKESKPVDLSMGHVNVIWQGDANEVALRSLLHCSVPSKILNVTGPETLSVRWLAEEFGKMFGETPQFVNEEKATALLSNAAESFRLFGYPKVPLKQIMELLMEWINQGGRTISKLTHFQERQGQF